MTKSTHTLTERDLILRVARAAVRDHARHDRLARYTVAEDLENGVSLGEAIMNRMYWLAEIREFPMPDQKRRTVGEVVRTAKVLGRSADLDPKFHSYPDGIVIRVVYAETWIADYEVCQDGSAICWQD